MADLPADTTVLGPAPSVFAPQPRAEPARLPAARGPRRSEFAPDPVRQRNYVDLRTPRPLVLDEPPRLPALRGDGGTVHAADRRNGTWLPAVDVGWNDGASALDVRPSSAPTRSGRSLESGAHSRGLDARTLSLAALLGVGAGLVGLTVVSEFVLPTEPPAITTAETVETGRKPQTSRKAAALPSEIGAGRIITMSQRASVKEESFGAGPPGPRAVIPAEGKTEAMVADAAPAVDPGSPSEGVEAVAPVVAVEPAPRDASPAARAIRSSVAARSAPVIPPLDAAAATRAVSPSEFEAVHEVLAYAPVSRPVDAAAVSPPARPASDSGPAQNRGPGTAKVTVDVHLRSQPDNNAPAVTVVASGTTVKIERCDFWCEVVANGKRGYVYRKFVGR